uniref:Pantetheinase n=1 Tax=Cercocebus atys TaxID=9531 RepID=A0A2K5M0Y0_CERAT
MTTQLLAYVAILLFYVSRTSCQDTFTAAVYEHAVILPNVNLTPVSREEALALMNRNLDILEGAITSAAQQGAHIIVTPEDGIYGWNFTRDSLYPYLEDIPDPEVNWIPCNNPNRFGQTPVQERLSCLAKNNSIYVVANIGDKKPCNTSDPQCPPDGRYQYNTDVVFDSQGKLVARYHKQNLFMGEEQFNVPKEPEIVTFNTSFGSFGIFTCFDILFHDPAVTLVKDFHVDTILFPTAWMNVLPHLSAVEFHSAWAMGMRVNFLASNIHYPSNNMTGSGIYAPSSSRTGRGRLLLSHTGIPPIPCHSVRLVNSYQNTPRSGNQDFKGTVLFRRMSLPVKLRRSCRNYTVALKKALCCHLNDCTLVKGLETASTRFEMFSLSGTFGTQYVFPEVLLSENQLAPGEFQVSTDGRLFSLKPTSGPVLTVTLFGRLYEKDWASTASSGLTAQARRIMLIVIAPIVYSLIW